MSYWCRLVLFCSSCTCHYLSNLNIVITVDSAPQKSLGEEVNELTSSRLLKLEKDNQTLLKTVEELKGAASQDTATKLTKLSHENQRLTQKVRDLSKFFVTLNYTYLLLLLGK